MTVLKTKITAIVRDQAEQEVAGISGKDPVMYNNMMSEPLQAARAVFEAASRAAAFWSEPTTLLQ